MAEFTPAFIAVGFLTGRNASYSFFSGAVLAWAIIGPSLVATGRAFGEAVAPGVYPGYMNYMGMGTASYMDLESPLTNNLGRTQRSGAASFTAILACVARYYAPARWSVC